MAQGDSFDESLAENGDYINDANTINNAGKGGSGSAGLTLEIAYSQSKSGYKQTDVVANNIFSYSDINLTSTDANLNINSSYLTALNNINLNAKKGGINITADTNKSDSFSRNLAFTISIPLFGKGGAGSIYFAKSKSESESYVNSVLTAGNQFNLNSKEDTNIISSNILASNINMTVGGNLNLESKQNTSKFKATSFGIGGGYSSSGGGKSANGNLSYSKSTSNRNWVDNQASILGTDSVTINVGETTNLIGSVIANSTNGKTTSDGIDGGNLVLNTKYLTYSNLQDSDEARSFGIGIGGNVRWGGASGGNVKGSGSLSLNYSMHDYEQDTNATIGQGTIKVGTTLNLDGDNNLVSVDGGFDYGEVGSEDYLKSGLNRNIQTAQVTTKHLEVNPISIKETFEFGRNSTESQMQASNATTDRPTIWSDIKDGKIQGVGSALSSIGGGILANAGITLKEFYYQIDPLRGFANIVDGISTDLRNMRTELDIKPIYLNNEDHKYYIKYQDGTQEEVSKEYAIAHPELIPLRISANGLMNNETEANTNAELQQGSHDKNGAILVMYDPTAVGQKSNPSRLEKIAGLFGGDLPQVSINYLGSALGGLFTTKGQQQDQEVITALSNYAKETGQTITLSGHSAGGLRNYLTLFNSKQNQFLRDPSQPAEAIIDGKQNSILQVMFYGSPVNNLDIQEAAQYSGAKLFQPQNKNGDFVGLVLGGNGSVIDAISGTAHLGQILGIYGTSPHSRYNCSGYQCDNNFYNINLNLNQDFNLTSQKQDSSSW